MIQLHLKKHSIKKTIYSPNTDYFVSVDFREQIKRLTIFLLYTSKNCSRKDHAWVHFVSNW